MTNFVINEKGALDIKDIPDEDKFEVFWESMKPYFEGFDEDCDTIAYMAAKVAWKQATMVHTHQKVFKLHWFGNKKAEIVIGLDIRDAYSRAGYSAGGEAGPFDWFEEIT